MLPSNELHIRSAADIVAAREASDFVRVTVETARLKYRNLLPIALKYALWSLRPGGTLFVADSGGDDPAPSAGHVSRNVVRQMIGKFIGRDVEWIGDHVGRIELRRTGPILEDGWSAGVVFSGNQSEIPLLTTCIDGLLLQPELSDERGGELVISGPDVPRDFLAAYPSVKYEVFPSPVGKRFLIGRKKNALMRRLKGPRFVILHARVVLDPGALARVPREFDVSGPATSVVLSGRVRRYLSLAQTDTVWPSPLTGRSTVMMRHIRNGDPLALHERGPVYIDGGAFYVTKPVFEQCPLSDYIAWNEAEDVEWCGRAFAQGFLVDMAPKSHAMSQTDKLGPMPDFGPFNPMLLLLKRNALELQATARHRWLRLRGLR